MADQADVAKAILDVVDAVREALNATWSTYRGFPEAAALDKELAAGDVHVTVNPRSGGYTRNSTRYLPHDLTAIAPSPTLTVSIAGNVVTFGGTADPGQAAGVQAGADTWVIRTAPGSTLASLAASLASIIPGATASGPVLNLSGVLAYSIIARIGADAQTAAIVRNTEQQFTVTVWCADPDTRDTVAAAIDAALTGLTKLPLLTNGTVVTAAVTAAQQGQRFVLSDYTKGIYAEEGHIQFAGDQSSDKAESANLYTRMVHYRVEYPTTRRMTTPVVLFPGITVNTVPYRP